MHEYVETVVVGGELPYSKPHPFAFEYVCKQLGCAPEDCAYVGDHPINDVDGSRNAGMTAIWIRSVGSWMDGVDPALYFIDQLGELPELLAKINQKM